MDQESCYQILISSTISYTNRVSIKMYQTFQMLYHMTIISYFLAVDGPIELPVFFTERSFPPPELCPYSLSLSKSDSPLIVIKHIFYLYFKHIRSIIKDIWYSR